MEENIREQQQPLGGSAQQDQSNDQRDQIQNTSREEQQDENPQRGSEWNNYRTRELSDPTDSGENPGSERSQ
ncbi:MAG: hypothetical protein J7502_10870 [Flavisolibacter sp.]|nr:hypothetical protein [Flavisolibacter sp.]